METVAIIIPCFNQAQFLAAAIESALAQTHPGCQIYVIDDGSDEHVSAIVSSYPILCLRQRNAGVSSARNRGVAISHSDCVLFLDADDLLLPGCVEQGLSVLRSNPGAAFAIGRCEFVDAAGATLSISREQFTLGTSHYASLLNINIVPHPACALFRRAAFERIGGFDPDLRDAEDYELYLRLAARYPVARHNHVVSQYRKHAMNKSLNAAGLLVGTLTALRYQRGVVFGNPALEGILTRSLRRYGRQHGRQTVEQLKQLMTDRANGAIVRTVFDALRAEYWSGVQA